MTDHPIATEDYLYASDGLKLFYRSWLPAERPKEEQGSVVIVHGFGEHSGRYEPLAHALCARQFAVYAADHRGHGHSEGKRGHIDRFDELIDDLDRMIDLALMFDQKPRLFLIGHSGGGLIAVRYASRYQHRIQGLVLSSPLFGIALPIPRPKLLIGRFLAKILPRFTMRSGVDPSTVSHDAELVARYADDPLVHDRISMRFYEEISHAINRATHDAQTLTVPTLTLQAGDDRVVSSKAAHQWYAALTARDKTWKLYNGWYHELFNEVGRAEVYREVVQWIVQHHA